MIRIVAYQTEIAQNLGNMIRSSACFDVPISVIEPCGFPFSIKVLKRAAMDYAQIAKISQHADWSQFCEEIKGRRVLLSTKGQTSYTDFSFQEGDSLIFGRESAGVPENVVQDCESIIKIPMAKAARSLNLSTSVGIVVAEALRQLEGFPNP